MTLSQNALAKITRSVWELNELVKKDPGNYDLRRDLLLYFLESKLYMERKIGVPERDRSFLLMQEKEAFSCFLLHGAGGSPAEMRGLAEYLYEMGFTVFAIKMNLGEDYRHEERRGSIAKILKKDSADEPRRLNYIKTWGGTIGGIETAFEIMLSYDPNVSLVGFSFGGTVALDLLRRYPARKAILISPALIPRMNVRHLIFKTLKKVSSRLARNLNPAEFLIIDYIDRVRSALKPVDKELLVIQAKKDPILSLRGVKLLERFSANERSKFIVINSSRHTIIKGKESKEVFDRCGTFLRGIDE